jgi:hypothetical protein
MEFVLGISLLVALALGSFGFGVDSREWVEERPAIRGRPRRSI